MTGTDDIDHVEIVMLNHAVQMDVDEIETRRGAPVAHQPGFDMLPCQRLLKQRIIE